MLGPASCLRMEGQLAQRDVKGWEKVFSIPCYLGGGRGMFHSGAQVSLGLFVSAIKGWVYKFTSERLTPLASQSTHISDRAAKKKKVWSIQTENKRINQVWSYVDYNQQGTQPPRLPISTNFLVALPSGWLFSMLLKSNAMWLQCPDNRAPLAMVALRARQYNGRQDRDSTRLRFKRHSFSSIIRTSTHF